MCIYMYIYITLTPKGGEFGRRCFGWGVNPHTHTHPTYMYLYVYIYIYVCICIYAGAAGVQTPPRRKAAISGEDVSGEGFTRTHTLTPHVYICMYIHLCVYVCLCIYTGAAGVQTPPRRKAAISGEDVLGVAPHTSIYILMCMYVYIYACIRMYMYIYRLRRCADLAPPKGGDFGRSRFGWGVNPHTHTHPTYIYLYMYIYTYVYVYILPPPPVCRPRPAERRRFRERPFRVRV